MTYGADMDIPCTYPETPEGFTEEGATDAELRLAGFHSGYAPAEHKPGTAPAENSSFPERGSQWDPPRPTRSWPRRNTWCCVTPME